MATLLGTSAFTHYFEDGEEIYPCRCGLVHRGDYAAYDFGHHNCFHETDLIVEQNSDGKYQVICPDCGMSWLGEGI